MFAIIQKAYQKPDHEKLGPILQNVLKIPTYDAMRMARLGRGIIAEKLEKEKADALQASLTENGFEVFTIPQEKVITIDKPLIVRRIEITEDHLGVVKGYTGKPEPVLWTNIYLVSAGEIIQKEEQRLKYRKKKKKRLGGFKMALMAMVDPLSTMVILAKDSLKQKKEKEIIKIHTLSYTQQVADIFCLSASGEYLHIRLRSRDMYFDKILGDRAVRDFRVNFLAVLAEIGRHAALAVISPETETLIRAGIDSETDISNAFFGEEEEFTQYNRWLMQMLILEKTK